MFILIMSYLILNCVCATKTTQSKIVTQFFFVQSNVERQRLPNDLPESVL